MNVKKNILILAISLLIISTIAIAIYKLNHKVIYFIQNNKMITLEIAKTEQERERGLMYRKFMPKNHGMIFIFEKPEILRFWMKNTLIPLDIIFLNNHQVIAIFYNVPPCKSQSNDCPSYGPNKKSDMVIELNAGEARSLPISVGDKLMI